MIANRVSTYNIVCECGAHVTSHERETVCPQCERRLLFEWGKEPVIVVHAKPKTKEAAA